MSTVVHGTSTVVHGTSTVVHDMSSTVIDNIGVLVTNDAAVGSGLLGVMRGASIVIQNGLIVSVGARGQVADRQIDAQGRCVIPGFVDSHTHLVFAGDRHAEFAARMAGVPYQAGGIRVTTQATRAATDAALHAGTLARVREAHSCGITTLEIKSGYGLTVTDEVRSLNIANAFTSETTFLGGHVVPEEFSGRTDDYVAHVCDHMLPACASSARWCDVFCEVGAFDVDQSRAILTAGKANGLELRVHGNQLGYGPGVQLAVEMRCASVDHCTYLADVDVDALASSDTVATLLPATDFSTRQPYPNARRLIDAGVVVALATNCNPGSSFTTSMGFVVALAVRDCYMTVDEAVWAATAGGARALRRDDIGVVVAGARADLVILDAPSYDYLAYRPGMPLVATTLIGGMRA